MNRWALSKLHQRTPNMIMKTFQRELCQKLGQDIPTLSVIEQKKQTHFVSLIEDYYDGIKNHLLEEHRILKKMEKQNRSIYAQRGELHEERRMALIEQKEKTDGFKKIADEMSCICNFVPVELPVDNISDQVRVPCTIQSRNHSPGRIPTVKLKIQGKTFLKSESRTSVTFKL